MKKSTKRTPKQKQIELVKLSRGEMNHMPKPRAGYEQFLPGIIAMYLENLSRLSIDGVDAKATLAEQALCERLLPAIAVAMEQLAMQKQTLLMHESNVWRVMLMIYDRALPLAKTDPKIAHALAAFQEFMKNGPRAPKKSGGGGAGGNG